MQITRYDPDRPDPDRPSVATAADGEPVVFTPFRTIVLGPKKELRIDLSRKGESRAVSIRLWKSSGRHRPLEPEFPWHLFPRELPELIRALTEAAAALGVDPAAPALE